MRREAELLAHRRRKRRDPLRVAGRNQAAELGRHRERFDRLAVRAGRGVEALERVPRCEQRRGEQQRTPDADPPVTVDAAVADRHQHARRRDREPGEPAARPRTTRRAATPCARATSTTNLRDRGRGRARRAPPRPSLGEPTRSAHASVRAERRGRDQEPLDEDRDAPRDGRGR